MNLDRVLDAIPDLRTANFPFLLVIAAVLTGTVCGIHAGSGTPLWGIAALFAALLALIGWRRLDRVASPAGEATNPSPWPGYVFLLIGLAVVVLACALGGRSAWEWAAILVPFALLALGRRRLTGSGMFPLIVVPILFGTIFLDTAILLGEPAAGGFPAVFAAFLILIGLTTSRLESRLSDGSLTARSGIDHPEHQPTIASLSTLFFFFGVIAFWPWLGKIYGSGYLWILVIGVLMPLLYLWGRLKQPHTDAPLAALSRFNRLLPYIGLILMVAILIG